MLLRYLAFCLGCGMVQTTAGRTPLPWQREAILDVPTLFMHPRMFRIVQNVALLSVIVELVLGYRLFGWWGLLIWLPFIPITGLLFPGKNPGPVFFIGILIAAVGAILIATA